MKKLIYAGSMLLIVPLSILSCELIIRAKEMSYWKVR